MSICNYSLTQKSSVIEKFIRNDSSNRIFVEFKIVINSNQIIGSNVMNSYKKYCIEHKKDK
jgi:hypothetical protein